MRYQNLLRVKVELVPHGIEEAATTLTEVCIGNDGTGGPAIGNYDVYLGDPRARAYPRKLRAGWVGRIENFPRHMEGRDRDRLAELALHLARGVDWRPEYHGSNRETVVKPGGWVEVHRGRKSHFLNPDGVVACRWHDGWSVKHRETGAQPRCLGCLKALEREGGDAC